MHRSKNTLSIDVNEPHRMTVTFKRHFYDHVMMKDTKCPQSQASRKRLSTSSEHDAAVWALYSNNKNDITASRGNSLKIVWFEPYDFFISLILLNTWWIALDLDWSKLQCNFFS